MVAVRPGMLPMLVLAALVPLWLDAPGPGTGSAAAGQGSDDAVVGANSDPFQITAAGHGAIFDVQMRRIALNRDTGLLKQEQLLTALRNRLRGNADADALLAKQAAFLAGRALTIDERIMVNAARTAALAALLKEDAGAPYRQQNALLIRHLRNLVPIRTTARITDLIRGLWPDLIQPAPDTGYMERCRAAGVPIPPDWSASGSRWANQGAVAHNMLFRGAYAGVYTWHDPAVRGACVALARDPRVPNEIPAAGIICQSAMTGAACFWDNSLRSSGTAGIRIDWRTSTLVLKELQDGDQLAENCTECHSGNNAFLVAPDDRTWGKLLRRQLTGVDHGTFSLRVRASTDNSGVPGSGGTARYVPISSQSGWRNLAHAPGCATGCHEANVGILIDRIPPMRPACAQPTVDRCYIDPF